MKTSLYLLTLIVLPAAAAVLGSPSASVFIWSDRYVYKPGDKLTLKGTIRLNGDTGKYTVVAFRQNNQTGKRTYYPGNTETPTDVKGRTLDQGFEAKEIAAADKTALAEEPTNVKFD